MQKLLSNSLIFVLLLLSSCLSARQVEPQVSRSEYLSLIHKGVAYLRESDKSYFQRGVMDENKINQAEALFFLARDLRMLDPEAIDGLASVQLRRGNLAGARMLFLECLKLSSDYGRAYVHLAYLEEIEGKIDISRGYLRKAISLNPKDSHALNNLGGLSYDSPLSESDKEIGRRMLIQAIELGERGDVVLEHNQKIIKK